MDRLILYLGFARNMGVRYTLFRLWYEFLKKTGMLKRRYPVATFPVSPISPEDWRQAGGNFFFAEKESFRKQYPFSLKPPPLPDPGIPAGREWLRNPESGYEYNPSVHWTAIQDFAGKAGDIKAVWEPSRFTFLYDLVRNDFHHKRDGAEPSFRAIEDWILHNPVNCGPNWKCSQEISIRVLNWTFALQYFKNSPFLTEARLNLFLNSIYMQARHVYANIRFSRIAVRNNHALTETLFLYIAGLLYPFFPESREWKTRGKKWFEKEIGYQVNGEGAFIQFSMNYHRMAVQLLTWAISLAHRNGEKWDESVYAKAGATITFLKSFQDDMTGQLPNYGSNDGSLLFPLADARYRDYRPQIGALAAALGKEAPYLPGPWQEETFWVTGGITGGGPPPVKNFASASFPESGYYVASAGDRLLFIRCGAYRHRPGQSDNLHLDLWQNGKNLLFDAGNFRYNTQTEYIQYYTGAEGHNTAAPGPHDQMLRGPRFIWSHWIKEAEARWVRSGRDLVFEGAFTGYRHLTRKGIVHKRIVQTDVSLDEFIVTDFMFRKPGELPLRQLWHPAPRFHDLFIMTAKDGNGNDITPRHLKGWYSERYGEKEQITYLEFATSGDSITTCIRRRNKK